MAETPYWTFFLVSGLGLWLGVTPWSEPCLGWNHLKVCLELCAPIIHGNKEGAVRNGNPLSLSRVPCLFQVGPGIVGPDCTMVGPLVGMPVLSEIEQVMVELGLGLGLG